MHTIELTDEESRAGRGLRSYLDDSGTTRLMFWGDQGAAREAASAS